MSGSSIVPGPRATAVLLVLAPLGMIVEGLASPISGDSTAADLRTIAAHPGAFELSVLVGTVATFLFVPAFLGLAQACLARTPRLARVAGWTTAAAMAGFVGVRMGQAVEFAGVQQGVGSHDLAATIDHASANWIGGPIFVVFLGGALLGTILLGIAGWRAGLPKAACVLLAVFQVVDVVAPDRPVPVAHVLLLVALGWIGARLWTPAEEPANGLAPEAAPA
jgi:hypothetical protein